MFLSMIHYRSGWREHFRTQNSLGKYDTTENSDNNYSQVIAEVRADVFFLYDIPVPFPRFSYTTER